MEYGDQDPDILFSVIIPAYNCNKSIASTLNSVQQQTFQNFELIIIDDGSTDNTRKTIEEHPVFSECKYYYQANMGVCAARNEGAARSSGKYLIFLDSDDIVKETWLEDFYEASMENDYDIIRCKMERNDNYGKNLKNSLIVPEENFGAYPFSAGTFIIKRSFFYEVGQYDENLKYGENTELSFRISEERIKVKIVDKVNFIYATSLNGGSKNLKNIIHSNYYILNKHPNWFKKRRRAIKIYLQSTAVACYKLNRFSEAQHLLLKAALIKPIDFKSWVRLIVSYIPPLGKKLWKKKDN